MDRDTPTRFQQMAMCDDPYFLIFLVYAPHLDYGSAKGLLRTIAKHPRDGSKRSDVGHAWIYLSGEENMIEGGHSGELGLTQPRYFEGVLNLLQWGYVDPTCEERLAPRFEPNPIRYLWEEQEDGFFQKGNGGHAPTFAAKVSLSKEQFTRIWRAFRSQEYTFSRYSLQGNQCVGFVAQVAAWAGISLETCVTVPIEQKVLCGGRCWQLWEDPYFSSITFHSPDQLERSLKKLVATGQAECALGWYWRQNPRAVGQCVKETAETIQCFPARYARWRDY